MLETAAAHGWVAGVVGWVPLIDPAATGVAPERHAREHPKFRGVRHLLHLEPDPAAKAPPAPTCSATWTTHSRRSDRSA